METKTCCTCKQEKTIDHFSRNKRSKDGYKAYCKECAAEQGRRYRQQHPDRKRESSRKAYEQAKAKANERTKAQEMATPIKTCSVCGIEKPISDFHRKPEGGYRAYCKDCANKRTAEYQRKNRDRIIQRKREYNAGRREEIHAYNVEYYRAHSEEIKARVDEWAKANPEWAKELQVLSFHRTRSRRAGVKSSFTRDEWTLCKAFFTEDRVLRCAYCGKPIKKATQDHVIPLAYGGENTAANIVPACNSCNASKGNESMGEWFRSKPFYSEEREKKIATYLELQKHADTERAT